MRLSRCRVHLARAVEKSRETMRLLEEFLDRAIAISFNEAGKVVVVEHVVLCRLLVEAEGVIVEGNRDL